MFGFNIKYSHLDFPSSIHKQSILFKSKQSNSNILFEYTPLKKFEKDKLFQENNDFIIGIDGIVLNLKQLKNEYGISDYLELIIHLFQKRNIHFVEELKGQFCGFIFQKSTEELFFFNNKTDTKQIFYSKDENGICVGNFFKDICTIRKKNSLNKAAVYDMFCFGGMIEEKTFVNGVSKLLAGQYLHIKENKLAVKTYFDYNNITVDIHTKKEAINLFDEAFIKAVQLEYEKDLECDLPHIATLSGGLDSRLVVMLAHKMNYKSKTFCFSQTGYDDEIIARKIAKDLELDFQFFSLDGSLYLKDLEKMVSCNAGLQFYNGSAHYNFALEQLDLKSYGLLHTGQIGDALLGGLLTKNQDYYSKRMSSKFLHKVKFEAQYRDEEIYKTYSRLFNLTNFGSFVIEKNGTYLSAPFFDDDVMRIGLSINPKLKYNQKIYIDWINEKHPETTKYNWERTGMKPTASWKTEFSRFTKKIKSISKKIQGKENLLSMTPDEYWFKKSAELQSFYSNYFKENISLLEGDKSLFKEVKSFYEEGGLQEKSQVLTILETIKQFGIEV